MRGLLFSIQLVSIFLILSCSESRGKSVSGAYANRNFNYDPFLVEVPYKADTLLLYEDFRFESPYWGVGRYELRNKFLRKSIILHYVEGEDSVTFSAPIVFSRTDGVYFSLNESMGNAYYMFDNKVE